MNIANQQTNLVILTLQSALLVTRACSRPVTSGEAVGHSVVERRLLSFPV